MSMEPKELPARKAARRRCLPRAPALPLLLPSDASAALPVVVGLLLPRPLLPLLLLVPSLLAPALLLAWLGEAAAAGLDCKLTLSWAVLLPEPLLPSLPCWLNCWRPTGRNRTTSGSACERGAPPETWSRSSFALIATLACRSVACVRVGTALWPACCVAVPAAVEVDATDAHSTTRGAARGLHAAASAGCMGACGALQHTVRQDCMHAQSRAQHGRIYP